MLNSLRRKKITILPKLDQDKSWLYIAFLSGFVEMLIRGFKNSNSVIYSHLLLEYKCTHEEASWVINSSLMINCMTAFLIGSFLNYLTPTKWFIIGCFCCSLGISLTFFAYDIVSLLLLMAMFYGFGFGLLIVITMTILAKSTDKYQATAFGISMTGTAIGGMAVPHLMEFLIQNFGFRGGMLLMGGVVFHTIPAAIQIHFQVRRKPEAATGASTTYLDSTANFSATIPYLPKFTFSYFKIQFRKICSSYKIVISSLYFWICLFIFLVRTFTYTIQNMIIVDFTRKNLDPEREDAVLLLTFTAAGQFVGRLGLSVLIDLISRNIKSYGNKPNKYFLGFSILLQGLTTILFPVFSRNYVFLCILSFLFGSFSGMSTVLHPVVLSEVLGIELIPMSIGLSTLATAPFSVMGPILLGVFTDAPNGTYDSVFYFTGMFSVLAGILMFSVPFCRWIGDFYRSICYSRHDDMIELNDM